MRPLLLLYLLLMVPFLVTAGQTGYRIVHPDGSVEYTDQPPPGAEPVPLPDVQTFDAPPTSTVPPRPRASAPKRGAATQGAYQHVGVTRPTPGEDFWVSQWQVPVALTLSPGLFPGHEVVVVVDGQEVARGTQTRYIAQPVYRGEHQVRARVVDQSGNVLISSDPVTFYVHKHQVNRP